MQKWEKIIDDLDKAMEGDIDKLVKSLPSISKTFYDELFSLVSQLKLRTGGKAPRAAIMAENLKKLQGIGNGLNQLLMDSGYKGEVAEYLASFDAVKGAVNEYYSVIMSNYDPSKELYDAIRKANVTATADSLLASGVNANFLEPVKKIMRDVVVGSGNLALMKEQLSTMILGNDKFEPRLKSYVGQVASDSIRQFQRNYIKAVSDDLGLKHYFYKGTAINDTRDFCQKRYGKYFTESEVKGWASLNWQGKARGTDEVTIFTYCGGYHCRHTILPVSETIYKARVDEG